jgi:phosphopantetheinyl transferase (holo-ACP synthase)
MIGNDVIDLALARKESNWQRPGFLNKIFTVDEQLLIANAKNHEIMVWNLWSRKEAAYKIYNRETGIHAYIPIQLECSYENESLGLVFCNGFTFYTQTEISNDIIHTIALTRKDFFEKVIPLDCKTEIIKKDGIPFTFDTVSNHFYPVSKSHHGRFTSIVGFENNLFQS